MKRDADRMSSFSSREADPSGVEFEMAVLRRFDRGLDSERPIAIGVRVADTARWGEFG